MIEVGPGPGGLTRALLAHGARVVAIERDERCLAALEEIADAYPDRLEIVAGDALKTDFAALAANRAPVRIVSNLPYNIGTELLVRWLTTPAWPPFWATMTLMFQREVAQRIVAAPDTASYGRLAVLAGWRAQARIVFDVPPQAFTPPPKVTSSLVHLTPRQAPLPADVLALSRVTEAAFGQRRKMLRQSLKIRRRRTAAHGNRHRRNPPGRDTDGSGVRGAGKRTLEMRRRPASVRRVRAVSGR